MGFVFRAMLSLVATASIASAIEVHPQPDKIIAATQRGHDAAIARTSPDRLYTWFGPDRGALTPHGFLMTKLDGLAVMTAHFGLRGLSPSELDQNQVLADPYLLVTITLFGDRPTFAVDSYVLLLQGERTIIPAKVRFDAKATRIGTASASHSYRAKVVAFFAYTDFDPVAKSRLAVFPKDGGEVSFDLDFAAIQ